MTAKLINGNEISKLVFADWKPRVEKLKQQGIQPGLAVIIVGENPASKVYVGRKAKACIDMGMHSEIHEFPATATEDEVLKRINELNANPKIHGMLVQLPLPAHIDNNKVLEAISVEKDADGFHLYNLGALVTGGTVFPPCTPYGVMAMLEHTHIPIEGKNAVVVGRSNIVGKPMALMLLHKNATISICTSKTRNLADYCRMADILVVATGKPKTVDGSMIKEGAVVIDVGINRMPDGKLVGDVDFDSVAQKAGYITPVPGGVGPMTVTMLVCNTIRSAERFAEAKK